MPHRDPQTGQFVAGDHDGAWAEADDVLYIEGTRIVDSSLSNGDTLNSHTLTVQRDYRIVGMETRFSGNWEEYAGGANVEDPPSSATQTAVKSQVATTGSYAEPGTVDNGGTQPAGVYDDHMLRILIPAVWDDNTNGGAAATPGLTQEVYHVTPAEEMVNVDVTPDAGSTISLHWKVPDAPGQGSARVSTEARIFVAERDE